jgi:hypothetical protein
MASLDTKLNKQGTAGKKKHVTVMVPQKHERISSLKVVKTMERSWLHTALN